MLDELARKSILSFNPTLASIQHLSPGLGQHANPAVYARISDAFWYSAVTRRWCSVENIGARVLIVDDDLNLTRLLRTILRTAGFEVLTAESGHLALQVVETEGVDLVILDLRMPVLDGRAVFREMRSRGMRAPVLIASAYGARSAQIELGAEGFIEKPFDPDRLVEAVNEVLSTSENPAQ